MRSLHNKLPQLCWQCRVRCTREFFLWYNSTPFPPQLIPAHRIVCIPSMADTARETVPAVCRVQQYENCVRGGSAPDSRPECVAVCSLSFRF